LKWHLLSLSSFSIPLPFIFQEAKESIDEEDPRPTSSNGAYIRVIHQEEEIYFDRGTITLKEGCSAIIQRTLPPKTKDLGSATIPCTIGKILLDLGANINLIHFSMVAQIGDSEIKPTRMSLQLADCSIKYPYGVVEDVLMKEDKFVFLMDFVVMDIKEDSKVPLILGRSFMLTI